MIDVLIGFAVTAVVAAAVRYIRKEKKTGCIGCPCSGSCGKKDCHTKG